MNSAVDSQLNCHRVHHSDAPIGIFDSGIGGLTVAYEVLRHLPHERIVYYADTAHVPYGTRNDEEIRQLTTQGIQWLYAQGCKMAIVACNSASAFSLDGLRAQFGSDFPIVGLVPAVKPAVIHTKSKVIAVLATAATFRGKLIQDVITHFALPAGVEVMPLVAPELVPLIEQGQADSLACETVLQRTLAPALAKKADHVVLGCTHYPLLKATIHKLYGEQLVLHDSGIAVARQCSRILVERQLLAGAGGDLEGDLGRMDLYFSGQDDANLKRAIAQLFGQQPNWRYQSAFI